MSEHDNRPRRWWAGCMLALAVLVFTRFRAQWPLYVDLHRWLASLGVPDEVRGLDTSLLLLIAALLGAAIAGPAPLAQMGWRQQPWRGIALGLLFSVPMLLFAAAGALLAGKDLVLTTHTAKGALLAPIVEETFFRGLLVAVAVRVGRLPFWPTAIASSLLFGSIHVPWNDSLRLDHLGTFSLTAVGGLWYAWLLREHHYNLWLTVALHGGMNAAWLLFAVGGGALGSGLWPNIGRVLTIVLGTVLTLRMARQRRQTPVPTA